MDDYRVSDSSSFRREKPARSILRRFIHTGVNILIGLGFLCLIIIWGFCAAHRLGDIAFGFAWGVFGILFFLGMTGMVSR